MALPLAATPEQVAWARGGSASDVKCAARLPFGRAAARSTLGIKQPLQRTHRTPRNRTNLHQHAGSASVPGKDCCFPGFRRSRGSFVCARRILRSGPGSGAVKSASTNGGRRRHTSYKGRATSAGSGGSLPPAEPSPLPPPRRNLLRVHRQQTRTLELFQVRQGRRLSAPLLRMSAVAPAPRRNRKLRAVLDGGPAPRTEVAKSALELRAEMALLADRALKFGLAHQYTLLKNGT